MNQPTEALDIRPVGGRLGAEVRGLDPDSMDAEKAAALLEALKEHLVLFLPGLSPSLEGLRRIGELFGPLEVHPYIPKADEGVPEVCLLDSDTPLGVRADLWHTDVTFSPAPPVAALPAHGGGPRLRRRHHVDQLPRRLRFPLAADAGLPVRADVHP